MPKQPPFDIIFADEAWEHLAAVEKKSQGVILEAIEAQLTFEPVVETRNRKPLSEPSVFGVVWEIRFGKPDNRFRVFYRIDDELHQVRVLAILVKRNNKLYVGNKEFEL